MYQRIPAVSVVPSDQLSELSQTDYTSELHNLNHTEEAQLFPFPEWDGAAKHAYVLPARC